MSTESRCMVGHILTSILLNLPSGWPLAARDERNRSDIWEMSLCTGCTPCRVAQRVSVTRNCLGLILWIDLPCRNPRLPQIRCKQVLVDLRVYWEQGELGCDILPPFSSPRCVCLTRNLLSTHSPQLPSTDGEVNPRLLSFVCVWEQPSQIRAFFLM